MYKVLVDYDFCSYQSSIISGHMLAPAISGGVLTDCSYNFGSFQTPGLNQPNVTGGTFSAGTYFMPVLTIPVLVSPSISGTMDFQNTAHVSNLLDGTTFQSPATVSQLNVAISGVSAGGGVTQEQVNNSISGHLLGDVHDAYVVVAPSGTTDDRNTIVAQSSAIVPLVVSGFWGGHEVNLQTWNNAGFQARVSSSCKVWGNGLDAGGEQITDVALVPTLSGHAASMNYVDYKDLVQVDTVVAYSDAQDLIVLGYAAATYQPVNALLSSLSTTVHGANQIFYTDAGNSTVATNLTPLARTLISGTTTAAMQSTLGLGDAAGMDYGRVSGTLALGNQEQPIHFNDFFNIHNTNAQWEEQTGGNGTVYIQGMTSNVPILEADEGDGYMRASNGAGAASTDWGVALPRDENSFGSCFRGAGRKHLFRGYYSSSSAIQAQWGITSNLTPSGMVPPPAFVFVVDSANTNIRFQHDDNQGNTTDTDTGVAIADYVNVFTWSEIHCISGQVTAYINGSLVATVTANLPVVDKDDYMFPFMSVLGNGGTWKSIYLDLYMMFGSATRLQDGIYT